MTKELKWIKQRYFPERRITMVSSRIKAVPKYILNALDYLVKNNVGLLTCVVQLHPHSPMIKNTLILDLTESKISKKDLIDGLLSLPGVEEVHLLELPLTHGEARLTTFTLEEMQDLLDMLRNLGTGGKAIMFNMGYRAGYSLASRIKDLFSSNREALEYMLLYHESLGHGSFKIKRYVDGYEAVITAKELFECVGLKMPEPNSHLFRGVLSGFLSKLWNTKVEVKETKCAAKGDEYCEFKITSV